MHIQHFARKLRTPALVLVLGTVAGRLQPAPAQTAGTATVSQTPPAVRSGAAKPAGQYNPNQMLRLVFGLAPPNLAAEEQFLRDLHTKGSPQFHRFLTAGQWNARFAPSVQDEQAVVDWAQAQGLTITQRFANRLLVDAEGPVSVIQKALNVTINSYQMGASLYYSNDRDPAIPASLAGIIHSVQGLNNLQVLRPGRPDAKEPAMPVYSSGPAAAMGAAGGGDGNRKALEELLAQPKITNGAYDPTDIYSSQAYNYQALYNLGHCCNPLKNPNTSPPEATIAIATAGAQDPNDFLGFHNQYSYLAWHYQFVTVDGAPPACPGQCDDEGTLDFEWATAMANGFGVQTDTAMVYMYQGANTNLSTFTDVYNRILSDDFARIFSTSWGCAETPYCYDSNTMDTDHAIFNQMVGQGWTLVGISHDHGSTADCAHLSVSYPGSDPNIVSSGGTTLSLSSSATYENEIGWTGGTAAGSCSNNDGGSGGGVSSYYPTPGYQESVSGNTGYRQVPDLALNADWVNAPQNYYFNGFLQGTGGTSIVAPELAGFFAQENAYLLYLGTIVGDTCGGSSPCAPMGNPNYYLYNEALNAPFALHYPFYDITHGCNSNDATTTYSLLYYCAATGYDMVTGWGSANMLQLAWAINTYLAGDSGSPVVTFSGPAQSKWYNTDQTVTWSIVDYSATLQPPNGIAGFSQAWDAAITDAYSESTPGYGNSFYSGPQFAGITSGSLHLASAGGQGCHTAHVEAWDNAGYPSGDQSYGPICYDTIVPTIQAVLFPSPNGAGWNNTSVQLTISASDPGAGSTGSGVAATYYAIDNSSCAPGSSCTLYTGPVSFTAQGIHTVYYYSIDNAGNYTTTGSIAVKVDETAPHTTAGLGGTLNGGSYTTPVTVTLTVSDNLSGVSATVYQIDGGSVQTYTTPFTVSSSGSHTVTFHSTDNAGNVESTESTSFTISTVYTISGQVTLGGNGLGGVQMTLSGTQSGSTTTNSSGNYTFTVAAAGSYTVTPSLTSYTFSPSSKTFNSISASQTANFTATASVPTYTISGLVTLTGNGLSGVTVVLSGSQSGSTTTSGTGNYSFVLSSGGNYTVAPSLSGYTFSPASQTFNNLSANQTANFTATAVVTSYTVSGQVTLSGGGLAGVTMTVTGSESGSTTTNNSGNYSFTLGGGGSYTITPSLNPYGFSPSSATFNGLSSPQTANFVAGTMPSAPAPVSPVNGAAGVGLNSPLTWSAASGATSYDIYFGTTASPPFVTNRTGTSYNAGALTANTNYYWSVAARNSYGSTSSATQAFSTGLCVISPSPASVYLDSTSRNSQLTVSASPAGCNWVAAAGGGFISLNAPVGFSGNGTVSFSVPINTTGADRSGTLSVGGLAVPVTQRATPTTFADVNPQDFYFDFANRLYASGITAGCSTSPPEYCPAETINRGQMAVFLVAAAEGGSNFSYTTTPYFTDVSSSNPFFKFIQKLKDLGITSGCSATEFCPNDPVTRDEMAAFIIRARYETTPYTYPPTPYFTDVTSSDPFFPFVQKMAQTGITAGCGGGLYCPNQTLNRGQMAVFIVTGLLDELLPSGTAYLSAASPNSAATGQNVTVTLTGVNTHFAQGSTQVTTGAGITASNVTVVSGASLTVQLTVGGNAAANPYSIVVTTGSEEADLPNGFTVQ